MDSITSLPGVVARSAAPIFADLSPCPLLPTPRCSLPSPRGARRYAEVSRCYAEAESKGAKLKAPQAFFFCKEKKKKKKSLGSCKEMENSSALP